MVINGKNPDTGEEYQAEAEGVDEVFVESMSYFDMADDEIKRFIDNLYLSADAKALLYKFARVTIRAGEYIIKIGRKILDFVFALYKQYPSATFGMIFGAIAGYLVSSIPIIGAVLGPIFTPIAITIGLIGGLVQDISDKELVRKITEINASFSPLGEK
jgi:hypothetical protein